VSPKLVENIMRGHEKTTRRVFFLSLFVLGLSIFLRSTGSEYIMTLRIVGLIACVTCLGAAVAMLKATRREKSQD